MKNLFITIFMVILGLPLVSQDIIATSSVFDLNPVDYNGIAHMDVVVTNNSFSELPIGEVHLTVTFPAGGLYVANGTITGGLASYFNLQETSPGVFYSLNTVAIPSFVLSPPTDIAFQVVAGTTDGTESSNVFVDLENLIESPTDQINNINDAELTVSQVLPLDFISFDGSAKDCDRTQLIWTTANEINNSGFEVQRSANGVEFENVGFLEAKTSNGRELKYEFNELLPDELLNTTLYYRLKQIDFDGRFEYSSTISVKSNCERDIDITITPNPATTLVNFNFEGLISVGTLTIMNDIGELVRKIKVDPSSAYELNVDEFIPGIYTVRGEFDNTFFNKRFIKID